jgi:hypothetical protein
VRFSPTSASWLNLAERFFAQISEKWIKPGAHTSVAELEQSIRDYIDTHNADPKPFVWHKTAGAASRSPPRINARNKCSRSIIRTRVSVLHLAPPFSYLLYSRPGAIAAPCAALLCLSDVRHFCRCVSGC